MPANYFESDIDLGLPAVPKSPLPEMQGELEAIYFAIRKLQAAFTDLCGVSSRENSLWTQLTPVDTLGSANLNRLYVQASEAIAFGAIVSLHAVGGALRVRNAGKAWATNTLPTALQGALTYNAIPHGFCNTVGGIASGATGEIIVGQGLNQGISGLTVGATYYLADDHAGVGRGRVTTIDSRPYSPDGGVTILQYPADFVGLALSSTLLWVNLSPRRSFYVPSLA